MVEFIPTYLDPHALGQLIRQARVVLLPNDSTEQVTSGVLVEAIAARRPVVATCFPHAVEMLSNGCGLVVPYQDSAATSRALRLARGT
jgi:polysaccharide biosynthesis protein PslF